MVWWVGGQYGLHHHYGHTWRIIRVRVREIRDDDGSDGEEEGSEEED